MAILTVAELRTHVETGLSDAALQRILDAETAEIARHAPGVGTHTNTYRGGAASIMLHAPAATIVSVVETNGLDSTTLSTDDYYILNGGRTLQRRGDGSHAPISALLGSRVGPVWGEFVIVSYTTAAAGAASAQQALVLVNLCKLAIRYPGLQNEAVSGDYSETALNYQRERAALLASLRVGGLAFA